MSSSAATIDHLLPRPRRARHTPGVFRLSSDCQIVPVGPSERPVVAARRLQSLAWTHLNARWPIRSSASSSQGVAIVIELTAGAGDDQAYALRIWPEGIQLRARTPIGLHYAVVTLGQLLAAGCRSIRAMDLHDRPDFPARGVMLDISRDKVPTIKTLERLIDRLAGWKINQLQLYTEHTFAYARHQRVWRGASPLTAPQVRGLDRYCRERYVELVPNQNSFGHMERWLRHAPYARLAETTGPWKTPWGETRTRPATLNPLAPGSFRLIADLYDQLLPHFTSHHFNIGCDETWELGQGHSRSACRRRGVAAVYFQFLSKLAREARRHRRRAMFWSDLFYDHPELIPRIPVDMIPLVWGYEAGFPFGRRCAPLAASGLTFYVCPGTSSWCSFAGRTHNCLANIRNAAHAGRRYGAAGFLIADWGDFGHRQYLPASYVGFLYGAATAWCARTNEAIDVPRELSRHAFADPTGTAGRLWFDVGNVHEASGVSLNNRTILFACMQAPLTDVSSVEGLALSRAVPMLRRIDEIEARVPAARFHGDDGPLVRSELLATLSVLRHASRRAAAVVTRRQGRRARDDWRWLAGDMSRIIQRHRGLWLARNRRGGLADSLTHYRRNLREYASHIAG
ncbi:MAG: family 20 glycosylhydrolase [Phycisphaerae bacterium]